MNFVTPAIIQKKIFHTEDILELIVSPKIQIKYNPGAFVQLTLENASASERWPDSRTFSIASYNDEYLRFLIQRQGKFTNRIFDNTTINQPITLKYPFGEMFNPKTVDLKHIFIAGGLGITPFLGLTEYFYKLGKQKNLTLFYSAKSIDRLIFKDFFTEKIDDLHLHITQEDSGFNNFRIRLDDISNYSNQDTHFYICGSKDFIENYRVGLYKRGITNIHVDEWN